MCHLFLNSVKCKEAKKACFKILAKTPDGYIRKLVTALKSIEAYPDKEFFKVRVALATSKATQLKTAGASVPIVIGLGISQNSAETAKSKLMSKRAKEDKQKEKKDKKKKKKRDEAKRAMELSNMDSPLESDEESSDDDNSGSPRALRITDRQVPTTSRAAKRAMEYIDSCSDLEVKKALDQTNLASKGKSGKQGEKIIFYFLKIIFIF